MNTEGQCQECEAAHCSACATGDKDKCECCRQSFDLVDGVCQCPENEVEEDGMCHPKVSCCVDYKNRECIKTTEDTTLVNGECICAKTGEKVDANGQCLSC